MADEDAPKAPTPGGHVKPAASAPKAPTPEAFVDAPTPPRPGAPRAPTPGGDDVAFAQTMVPDAPPPPAPQDLDRPALTPTDAESLGLEFGEALSVKGFGEALDARLSRETHESFSAHWAPGKRIGAGGMGEVHLARDVRIGREVAIKRMLPESAKSRDALKRFLREARVQGRLAHPSVVPVHDLGIDPEGQPYFVMKRIHGMTIGEILRGLATGDPGVKARFTRRKLLLAFQRALLTLDFAHQRGILHRDLKPGNLMLGDYGEVYVLDWGLAKVHGADDEIGRISLESELKTRDGAMIGTPGYAPPEQLAGRLEQISPASDVYAMGVVLYELLAIQRLGGAAGPAERMMATMSGVDARPSTVRPDVPPELDAICVRATALAPDDRYPTMRAFHDALDEFLASARDLEVAEALAGRHEARAADFASEMHDPVRALEARRDALREAGKALALKPGSEGALRVLDKMLAEPPPSMPPEVLAELEDQNAERTREAMRLGWKAYAMWLVIVPMFLWMGLREVLPLWVGLGGLVVAMGSAIASARARRPKAATQYLMLVGSTVAIACGARAFGPLVLVPQIVTANIFTYALTESSRRRILFVATSCLAMVVPFALEGAAVWSPSYMFQDGDFVVLPNLVELPAIPTLACLWALSLLIIVVSTYWAGNLADALRKTERDAALQRWHVAQLFGGDPRRETREPTAAHREGVAPEE